MGKVINISGKGLQVKEYKGERVVTLWDIARLHGTDVTAVRNNFTRNKKYLEENEDYFLLDKEDDFARTLSMSKEIDYHALNAVKNIPIFTESGYLMMVKPLRGELAWAVQRQLVKNYFAMKEVRETITSQLNPDTALEHSKFIMELAEAAGVSPQSKLIATKNLYRMAGIDLPFEVELEQKLYDTEQIAKREGVLSTNKKPHIQAMSAIIKQIDIPEELKVVTFEQKGNWQGSVVKYKEDVFGYVREWLEDNNYPNIICGDNRKYKVLYAA